MSGPEVSDPDASPSARKRHALELFTDLPAGYDRVGAIMSFGQDPRWRRALIAAVDPKRGQHVLDVATGTALVARELARAGAQVTGIDQSEEMLEGARTRLRGASHLAQRITLMQGEAEHLPFPDAHFDALTFTYLLRYVDDPQATLSELARVVKPGGRIGMLEFGVPAHPLLRTGWRVHTRAGLPIIGRMVSPAWFEVGRFLGPNIEAFHRAYPDLPTMWRTAGIGNLGVRRMSFGAGLVMWGVRDRGTTA